jgi:hypothetical protein
MFGTRRSPILPMVFGLCFSVVAGGADEPRILGGDELAKIGPAGFYYEGLSAPTQMRNAAAVRFAAKRNVIAALVDTSGYATSVREKYEGFFITDSKIAVGRAEVSPGAYGFGFTADNKMNLFDVGGNQIHVIVAARDEALQGPRPLAFVKAGNEIRLYRGRNFVAVKPR